MKKIKLVCAALVMFGATAAAQEIRSFTATHSNPNKVDRLQAPATQRANRVQLNWTVLTEKNIQRFLIERSRDNEHYKMVRSISKHFRLNELQQFSCTDIINNINSDVFYYRLKIVNKPGAIKISPAQVVRIDRPVIPAIIVADLAGAAAGANK